MANPFSNKDPLISFYTDTCDESQRLKHDIGPLEHARTQELLLRFLPPFPAVVLDVGGANGVYSFWLAKQGYSVHLVDIVPRHIEQAAQMAQAPGSPALASMRVGDARRLDFPDNCADAVILHGPLYHLAERDDRLQALAEVTRVLKPGGVLLAFAITRYAGLIYGLGKGYVFDPLYQRMLANEIRTGRRENPPAWAFTFPNAYFHLPEELAGEICTAGMDCQKVLGVIGPAWMVPDLDASWQDSAQREALLEIARWTENEPVLGPRLMAVGRK